MIRIICAYFRERLRPVVFGPVILLLAIAACWAADALHPSAFLRAVWLAALVVIQFRLWDDLADRVRDRATHPDRVLARANVRPFKVLALALALAGLGTALGLGRLDSFLALVALDGAFAVLYGLIRPHLPEAVWQYPVLLAKYPGFVVVVALFVGAPTIGRTVIVALLAYGGANLYEATHSGRIGRVQPNPGES